MLQRSKHYVAGLLSRPWWPAHELPQAAVLEAHSDEIAHELEDLVLAGRLRLHPQSPGGSHPAPLTNGDWNMFELWSLGLPHLGNLIEAPVTSRVLDSMRDAICNPRGNVLFSVLQPGAHVKPHCGTTNTRIRLQLGLHVPAGAAMRVGTETRAWEAGRCIAFDDSWEHEATNPGDRPRSVLIVDVWHPDLSAEQRTALEAGLAGAAATVGERGWIRRDSQTRNAPSGPSPIDPATFALRRRERLERLAATARRACELNAPVVAAAAARVLRVLATEPDRGASRGSDPRA